MAPPGEARRPNTPHIYEQRRKRCKRISALLSFTLHARTAENATEIIPANPALGKHHVTAHTVSDWLRARSVVPSAVHRKMKRSIKPDPADRQRCKLQRTFCSLPFHGFIASCSFNPPRTPFAYACDDKLLAPDQSCRDRLQTKSESRAVLLRPSPGIMAGRKQKKTKMLTGKEDDSRSLAHGRARRAKTSNSGKAVNRAIGTRVAFSSVV